MNQEKLINYMYTNKKIKYTLWLLVVAVFAFTSCKDELWNEHYNTEQNTSTVTLMEAIDAKPELSKFAEILRKTGYDKVLASSQTYTVWAPTNDALAAGIDTDTLERFVKNHIARFNYSTADLVVKNSVRIRMLNGKGNTFSSLNGIVTFGDANLIQKDFVTKNGVLHTIDHQVNFFQNTWENIKSITGLDSISKYLTSFDEYLFDAASSTEIGTSPQGIVYDSVFLYSNNWLSKYGRLQLEDSVYTMILPDETAWNEAYSRVKTYFKTYGEMTASTTTTKTFKPKSISSDSVQRVHTIQTIVQDLIFRGKLETFPPDSLVSTNRNVFYQPAYLFDGAIKIPTSNGLIYKTSRLKHNPLQSFHKRIVVEAEKSTGREFANATLFTRLSTNESFISLISEKKYIELQPSANNPNFQPEVSVEIPNTLAAKYNIYCVMVPAYERDTAMVFDTKLNKYRYTNDSTKVSFQLTYVGADGIMKTNSAITVDPVTNQAFVTSSKKMSTFLVAKNFVFPFANFNASPFWQSGTKLNTVKIKVKANVNNTDFTAGKYTRNLRVDCFILEPVNE